jgi:hypothetical protein
MEGEGKSECSLSLSQSPSQIFQIQIRQGENNPQE